MRRDECGGSELGANVASGRVVCVGITLLGISFISFFFNDTATTEIYTLSLHDALPIFKNILDSVFLF